MGAKDAGKQPAPNSYNREAKSAVLKRAPAFGFGTSRRPATEGNISFPGPGAYPTKTIMGTDS